MCRTLSRHIWSHLTSPHPTPPTSPHPTSPHLTYFTSPHLTDFTSPPLTSPHLTSPHLTSPHLSSPQLIPPHPAPPCSTPSRLAPPRPALWAFLMSACSRHTCDSSAAPDCCRVEAQQAHVRTLLVTGRYEEAAESARELFESCTEAGMQVGGS